MLDAASIYDSCCASGDLARFFDTLSAQELKALHAKAEELMQSNAKKGGIPALVKQACVVEGAKRFLS